MNLYKLMFDHYSQKDWERGILTYLIADSSESIYEWFKSEPKLSSGDTLWNSYSYNEEDGYNFEIWNDNYEVVGIESFKERMIRLGGEMFDEATQCDDRYYGLTHYGWTLHLENIKEVDQNTLLRLNVAIKI